MDRGAHLSKTRATYDIVAGEYARLLPDLRAETPLDRAMLARFAELVTVSGLGRIGDFGCGTGRIAAHLSSLGPEVFGLDLSPAMVDLARLAHPDLRFDVGSITALDLPDGSVGGVLAWYSTIHTPPQDLPIAFSELARVLAPGGPMLIGFHVGDGRRPRTVEFRDGVTIDTYDIMPERVVELVREVGLVVHTQLVRSAEGRESRPQASVIAVKPA